MIDAARRAVATSAGFDRLLNLFVLVGLEAGLKSETPQVAPRGASKELRP